MCPSVLLGWARASEAVPNDVGAYDYRGDIT